MSAQNQKKSKKKLKEDALKKSIVDGSAYTIMDNSGNSYISPFALALGAGNTFIGFLSALPNFMFSILQLKTPKLIEKYPRKKIVVFFAFLQALVWIPIISLAFFGAAAKYALAILLISYVTLIALNSAISPAWNSWMRDLVNKKENGRYFAKRHFVVGVVGLISLLITGFLLDYFKKSGKVFFGFTALFVIAFFARLVSVYYLKKQYEPKFKLKDGYYFSFGDFIEKMAFNNFGRFVLFIALFSFAVNFAGPLFTVYMLKNLNLSYTKYTILQVTLTLGTLGSMPLWGKINDRYGELLSLRISVFLISLVPLLFLFSKNFYYLIFVQIYAGIFWGAYNLSVTNFIYSAVTKERIGICVSYFNIIQTTFVFVGATLGAYLSTKLDFGMDALLGIFLLSFVMRIIVSAIMVPMIKEVKKVKKFDMDEILQEFHTHLNFSHKRR